MKPIDRKRLRTVSAKRRHSIVKTSDFARPVAPSAGSIFTMDGGVSSTTLSVV